MAKFPTYEEMGKKVAEKALDEFLYDGKSIREWMQIIASEDAISKQAVFEQIGGWIASGEYEFTNATDYLSKRIKAIPSGSSSEKPRLIDPAYEKTLNKWIGAEVLDRIRNEMHATAEKHEDGVYYLRDEWIDVIIDKYAEEDKA